MSLTSPDMCQALTEVTKGLQHIIDNPEVIAPNQDETSLANLKWMCEQVAANAANLPIDKVNRWIGFVQGVLAAQGFMSVSAERDRTRPIFHELYRQMGLQIPTTLNR